MITLNLGTMLDYCKVILNAYMKKTQSWTIQISLLRMYLVFLFLIDEELAT